MGPDRILRELKSSAFSKDKIRRVKLFYLEGGNTDSSEEGLREWYLSKIEPPQMAREVHDAAQSMTDELQKKSHFIIVGYDPKGKRRVQTRIRQVPDREDEYLEPSTEGQVGQQMQHVESLFRMSSELLDKQASMNRDLMDQYHKRMNQLEQREDILSEIVREFRDVNQDHEEKVRKEERFDRFIEVITGYLAPAAAEKLLTSGVISPETAAGISAASKEISEELSDEDQGGSDGHTN